MIQKKLSAVLVIALFFLCSLSFAQVPRGTYVPKNDMAKQSNWTKFEFTGGNKVKAYIGAMGVTVACYEYIYTLNGNNLSLSVAGQNGSAEGYTYNKVTDEISLHAGAFGTEGAIWHKAGATNNNATNNTTATKPTAPTVQQKPTTNVSGEGPKGIYLPMNEAAKMSNFTKFEFTGVNKLKAYLGVMGTSVAAFDYVYKLNGNNLSLMEAGKNGSVEFTYDRAKDQIALCAGAFGTEGAIWSKNGQSLPKEPEKKECDTKPNNKSIIYFHELAKKCALFSALAYQETRITCKSGDLETFFYTLGTISKGQPMPTSMLPTKEILFSTFLSNYKKLKDNNEIIYFTGKKNDNYVKKNDDTPYVLHAELKYNGYQGIESQNYHDGIEDNISYTFAYKKGDDNKGEGNDVCVAVILRGTDYVEWRGNMKVWEEKNKKSERHYSFQNANAELQKALRDYLNNTVALKNKNIHFLITGHSRGAAVANLLAVDLNEGAICNIKSVVAYTFATPNNRPDAKENDYNNIFNFCFDDDFVPQVPLEKWGYKKSGITRKACAEELWNFVGPIPKEKDFRIFVKEYVQLSKGREPSFDSDATQKVLQEFYNTANNVSVYYNNKLIMSPLWTKYLISIYRLSPNPFLSTIAKNINPEEDKTLYEFMRDYIASGIIAIADGDINSAVVGSVTKKFPVGNQVEKIANFFIDWTFLQDGKLIPHERYSINDTHQAFTYYYALLNDSFKLK